jgi:hypothetical protein
LARGAGDAAGNLAAICNQDGFEHEADVSWPRYYRAGGDVAWACGRFGGTGGLAPVLSVAG